MAYRFLNILRVKIWIES